MTTSILLALSQADFRSSRNSRPSTWVGLRCADQDTRRVEITPAQSPVDAQQRAVMVAVEPLSGSISSEDVATEYGYRIEVREVDQTMLLVDGRNKSKKQRL